MNHSTRKIGRRDLSAGYARMNELAVPTDQQFIDLASLPKHVVLELDGIRFDAEKVIAALTQDTVRRQLQASTFPTDTLIDVSQSQFSGQRTIPLYGLVKDGCVRITINDVVFTLRVAFVEQYIWDNRSSLAAKQTPVDLETLPAGATVTLDNFVVSAHKLRQLVLKKLTGIPAESRKFQLCEVDSAEDTGLYHTKVSLERLSADGVYAIGAHEYNRNEVEQLLILNVRKLNPRRLNQRLTASVKTIWTSLTGDVKAFHAKYPGLSMLLITMLTASVAIRILRLTALVDTVGKNILDYMNESLLDPNGNIASAIALNGVNLDLALGLIDLVFIAFGSYIGYYLTHKSRKPLLNIPLGVLAGILVFRGVQLILFVAFASTLH